MTINKLKYEQLCWILIWLSVSAISWYLVELKYLALDFHTRDYAFYTEFIIKWSKPVNEQYYTMNPGGYNFLGVNTVDGCDGFYQWVHFEPIRFVQAFIYKIFHSLHAVFIFNALLLCSPILAIGLWLKNFAASFLEKIVWVLFFIVFPATLLTAGYDNRPSMFLGIGYFWLLYFLLATKSKWGQYISFLLLFSIREEALILNGIVCLYFFFKWKKREVSADWFLLHLVTLIAYVTGLSLYFNYWNYELFTDTTNKYSIAVLIPMVIFMLTILIYAQLKNNHNLLLFIPLLLFVFQIASMYIKGIYPDEKFSIYNDPRILIAFLICLAWMLSRRSYMKKFLIYIVACCIPVFVGFSAFAHNGLLDKVNLWRSQYKQTVFIFKYSKKFNIDTKIFTDYSTHQAFLQFPHLFCVDRLPCYMERSSNRFYPENKDMLIANFQYNSLVVVSNQTSVSIKPVINIAGFDFSNDTNERYTILRLFDLPINK